MESSITIFTRDHKSSGNTNEYQRDIPVEYIRKYSFKTSGEPVKVSVAKGTTSWFPNHISIGVTSKTDENILDAPEIEFEVDKEGSKKDTSLTRLNECKVKGIKISFQLDDICSMPVLELFITYRRAGNKATVRDVNIRRIKMSHRIVIEGPIEGVSVQDSVIKTGIVLANGPQKVASSHSDFRPDRKEDECSAVTIYTKKYGVCTVTSPQLKSNGTHTEDEYQPEQYIACPRSIPELEKLFVNKQTLSVKFDTPSLEESYKGHRFLAALLVLVNTSYARYITEHEGRFFFVGHILPNPARFKERYWALDNHGIQVIDNGESEEEEAEESEESDDDFCENPSESGDADADADAEDEDEPLHPGEDIEDDDNDEEADQPSSEGDDKEIDEIEEDEDDNSSNSSKKRKATVLELIDDEASEDNEIEKKARKRQKVADCTDDIEAMELE